LIEIRVLRRNNCI